MTNRQFLLLLLAFALFDCGRRQESGLPFIEDYPTVTNTGLTYYIDPSAGDDTHSGLSPSTPWKSVIKLNNSTLGPGDSVLFKRGSVFRDRIEAESGTAQGFIRYGAYGTGSKPLFLGSVSATNVSDWTNAGGNIWVSTSAFSYDVGNVIFNNGATVGVKKWSLGELSLLNDYYYDSNSQLVVINHSGNPASSYSSVELALNWHSVNKASGTLNPGISLMSNIVFENLDFRNSAACGLNIVNSHHIIVQDCDFSWIGGGFLHYKNNEFVRYGNAVQMFKSVAYIYILRNKIWEIYDTAITPQNTVDPVLIQDIYMRNNIMWNNGLASMELWCTSEGSLMTNIYFENNSCYNAGMGWGSQRPDPAGYHVVLSTTFADTGRIFFRNNIFSQARSAMLVVSEHFDNIFAINMDYNIWHSSTNTTLIYVYTGPNAAELTNFQLSQSNAYEAYTGFDTHSIYADPLLSDPANGDYSLQGGSPAVNRGINTGVTKDFLGNPVPNGAYDIGAVEL